MAAASKTTFSAALLQYIPQKMLTYVGYKNNPLWAVIPKDSKWNGSVARFPIWHGGNQGGVSSVFATGQANKSAGLYKDFQVTSVKKYGLTDVENELLQAGSSDVGALLRPLKAEITQTSRNVSNDLGMAIYRNFGGARGRVGSTSSMNLTLLEIEDVVHFAEGMVIVSDDTDGTAGGAADAEQATISAVNLDTGVISRTDANWTASGNFSNNDYLFRAGDFGVAVSGLDSWIPASPPTSSLFFNVDRSTNPVRLGGMRYDGSLNTISEALLNASARLGREGASPDLCAMNWKDFNQLRLELGDRIEYDSISADGGVPISFKTIVLPGPQGNIRVMSDRNCQRGVAWLLQLDTWKFVSHGSAPMMLKAPGEDHILWVYNADAVEIRTGWYGNLGCHAPGFNCRVTLPTA